jgi:hypothetical protein
LNISGGARIGSVLLLTWSCIVAAKPYVPYKKATAAQKAAKATAATAARRAVLNHHVSSLENVKNRTPIQQAELVNAMQRRAMKNAPSQRLATAAAIGLERFSMQRAAGHRLSLLQQRAYVHDAIANAVQQQNLHQADLARVVRENAEQAKLKAEAAAKAKAARAKLINSRATTKASKTVGKSKATKKSVKKTTGKKAAKAYAPRTAAKDWELPKPSRFSGWPSGAVCYSPVCVAASVADCLMLLSGRVLSRREIRTLHYQSLLRPIDTDAGNDIPSVLRTAVSLGFITSWFEMAEIDPMCPATIAGITLPAGDHAVCTRGDGLVISWGEVIELPAPIDEQYIFRV